MLGLLLHVFCLWALPFTPPYFLVFIIVNLYVLKVNEVVGGWLGTGPPDVSNYQAFPIFRAKCNHQTMWTDSQQTYSYTVKYVVQTQLPD